MQVSDPEQTVAELLGVDKCTLPGALVDKVREDPEFIYHIEVCLADPEMLSLLLQRYTDSRKSSAELIGKAAAAYGRWLSDGIRTVPDKQYKARIETCGGCPHRTAPGSSVAHRILAKFGTTSVCELCGCDIHRKARLPKEKCPDIAFGPLGRWDR